MPASVLTDNGKKARQRQHNTTKAQRHNNSATAAINTPSRQPRRMTAAGPLQMSTQKNKVRQGPPLSSQSAEHWIDRQARIRRELVTSRKHRLPPINKFCLPDAAEEM